MRNTRGILIFSTINRYLNRTESNRINPKRKETKRMVNKKKDSKSHVIIDQCIELLRREDLKYELKMFFEPVVSMIFNIINPYIYMFLGMTIIILILLIAILLLLVSSRGTMVSAQIPQFERM